MSERIWHNTAQAGERSGSHPDTVRKAVEAGELHGTQRKAKGRWRIHRDCIDAWCAGQQCQHQMSGAA
jgi:hypothetical protein